METFTVVFGKERLLCKPAWLRQKAKFASGKSLPSSWIMRGTFKVPLESLYHNVNIYLRNLDAKLWALSLTISFDLPYHSSQSQSHTEDLGGVLYIRKFNIIIMAEPRSEGEKPAGEQNRPCKSNFYWENSKSLLSDSDLCLENIEKEDRNMLVTLCQSWDFKLLGIM